MGKIEFEDRTKPQGKSDLEIEQLASSFFTGAVRVGLVSGYTPKEIVKAYLIGAKDLCHYALEMQTLTEEDLEEIKKDVERISEERFKAFRESGLLDAVKRVVGELKGEDDE